MGRTRTRGPEYESTTQLGGTYSLVGTSCVYGSPILVYFPASRITHYEVCLDELHPGPPYRSGGPLLLRRLTASYHRSDDVEMENYPRVKYKGHFAITSQMDSTVQASYDSFVNPTAYSFGAKAFQMFRPVKPKADAGQWLAELRDFPSMLKWKIKAFKDLGGSYLNYQFGWRPFIKSIVDFIKTQDTIENRIARIRKYNGKWQKRGGTIRNDQTTEVSSTGPLLSPVLGTYFYDPYPRLPGTKTVIWTDRVWFEAAMKYYIYDLAVDSAKDIWTSKLRRRLLGLDITPSLLWELLPYTWLQNWCINVGDVLRNLSDQAYDNLVCKYAYVMRHRTHTVILSGTDSFCQRRPKCIAGKYSGYYTKEPGPVVTAATKFRAECKERYPASQWGFGNGGEEFTPRQLAILLALGVSKI